MLEWGVVRLEGVLCIFGTSEMNENRRKLVELRKEKKLKVNAVKSKVMVLDGEEGLECEVCVDGIRLEYISEFKYWGCVLDE